MLSAKGQNEVDRHIFWFFLLQTHIISFWTFSNCFHICILIICVLCVCLYVLLFEFLCWFNIDPLCTFNDCLARTLLLMVAEAQQFMVVFYTLLEAQLPHSHPRNLPTWIYSHMLVSLQQCWCYVSYGWLHIWMLFLFLIVEIVLKYFLLWEEFICILKIKLSKIFIFDQGYHSSNFIDFLETIAAACFYHFFFQRLTDCMNLFSSLIILIFL